MSENNIKTKDLCERCVFYGCENCDANEIPDLTPCEYFYDKEPVLDEANVIRPCKYNDGVLCRNQSVCDECAWNPYAEELRNYRVSNAVKNWFERRKKHERAKKTNLPVR